MVYFSLGEFDFIEERGGFWLTSLPLTVGVKFEDSESLEHHLDRCKRDVLDIKVCVGSVGEKCRLVAVRAAPDVAEKRRAQRRKTDKDSGKLPFQKALIRDGWHLMLTNLGKDEISAAQLVSIYRARWAVEIQFRAWKQALNRDSALNRHSNEHHMMALILPGMIAHQLGMSAAERIEELAGRTRVSYEKLYASLATHLVKARNMRELCQFSPELRHVIRDKRRHKSPIESGILALT